jgi:hypothetical protein
VKLDKRVIVITESAFLLLEEPEQEASDEAKLVSWATIQTLDSHVESEEGVLTLKWK